MRGNKWKIITLALMAMVLGLAFGGKAEAASLGTEYYVSGNEHRSWAQVNGGGNMELLHVKLKPYEGSDYFYSGFTVDINGKKVLTKTTGKYGFEGLSYRWITCDKKKQYMQITLTSSGGFLNQSVIYRYANGKLTPAKTLISRVDNAEVSVVKATKSGIIVKYSVQPGETGRIEWKYTFRIAGKKLKLKSSTAKVVSYFKKNSAYVNSPYRRYFAKNQFVTKKGKTYYTKPGGKKKQFRTKSWDLVTLSKVKIIKKKMYLGFKKGGKLGWIRIRGNYPSNGEWFHDIMLAG